MTPTPCRLLLDGPAIAHELGLDPALIRQWASRGRVERHGKDSRGRTLLDLDEVESWARARGVLTEDA